MQDDATSPTRRNVLKATGAAMGTAAVGAAGATARDTPVEQALPDGTRVFTETGVGVEPPESTETAGPSNADLLMVNPRTGLSRSTVLDALERGAPVAYVGRGAFDGALGTLFDRDPSTVERAARTGDLDGGPDVSYSFGFEYSFAHDSVLSLLAPGEGVLNSHRLQGGRGVGRRKTFSYIGQRVTTSDDGSLTTSATSCGGIVDDPDKWECLSADEMNPTDVCPQGDVRRSHRAARLKDDSSSSDWWGFDTTMSISPSANANSDCSSSAWYNHFMTRTINFNDGTVGIDDYEPQTDDEDYTSTKEIGFSIGGSFKDGLDGTVSVAFSESNTESGLKVGAYRDDQQVDTDFDIKSSGNVGDETVVSHMGQAVETQNNLTSTSFSYDDQWEWKDPGFFGDSYEQYNDYGTAYWSV